MLLNSSREKCFRIIRIKNQNTNFTFHNIFLKIVPFLECEKCCVARQDTDGIIIWRMRFARWISNVAGTLSEYVMPIAFTRLVCPTPIMPRTHDPAKFVAVSITQRNTTHVTSSPASSLLKWQIHRNISGLANSSSGFEARIVRLLTKCVIDWRSQFIVLYSVGDSYLNEYGELLQIKDR